MKWIFHCEIIFFVVVVVNAEGFVALGIHDAKRKEKDMKEGESALSMVNEFERVRE